MERTAAEYRVGENLRETRGQKVKARIATWEAFASTAKFRSRWSLSLVSSFVLLIEILCNVMGATANS
jgi:hypothetical protein